MLTRAVLRTWFTIVIVTGCTSCGIIWNKEIEQEKVVGSEQFRIRLVKLGPPPPLILPPSVYRIDHSVNGDVWTRAYSWQRDDPWELSKIDVQVLSPTTGYFFNVTHYGVTVNAGRTWKVFDVYEASRAFHSTNWPKVKINADGEGSLYFGESDSSNEKIFARTFDFGQSWALAPSKKINN